MNDNFDTPASARYPPAQNFQGTQHGMAGTPSPRSQIPRSRFGFHVPSPFPRPRSSASKPNPSPSFNSISEEPISDNYYPSPDNFSKDMQQNRFQNNNLYKMANYPSNSPNFTDVNFDLKRSPNFSDVNFDLKRSPNSMGKTYNQNYSPNLYSYTRPNRSPNTFGNTSYSQNRSLNTFGSSNYSQNRSQNSFSNANFKQNQYQNSSFSSQMDDSYDIPYETSSPFVEAPFKPYSGSTSHSGQPNPKWKNFHNSVEENDSSYATCSDSSFPNPNDNQYVNNSDSDMKKHNFLGNPSRVGGNSNPQFDTGFEQTSIETVAEPMNTQQQQTQLPGKFKRPLKRKAPAQQLNLRCELCAIDFASQAPHDMHIQGAKHARKLKSIETLKLLQLQGFAGPDDTDTTIFHCEPCNLSLNGAMQFQTHCEGNKHRQKTNPKPPEGEAAKENGKESERKENGTEPKKETEDVSLEPPPPKMQLLSCELCGITVNSNVQLEQHIQSKKHKAKVEGTPLPAKKWKKKKAKTEDAVMADMENNTSEITSIPDITTSFVKPVETVN